MLKTKKNNRLWLQRHVWELSTFVNSISSSPHSLAMHNLAYSPVPPPLIHLQSLPRVQSIPNHICSQSHWLPLPQIIHQFKLHTTLDWFELLALIIYFSNKPTNKKEFPNSLSTSIWLILSLGTQVCMSQHIEFPLFTITQHPFIL